MNLPYIWPSIVIVALTAALFVKDIKLRATNSIAMVLLWIILLGVIFTSVVLIHAGLEWAAQA